jgi:hypothetical protein
MVASSLSTMGDFSVHPELFELKALVAGRLDMHRRREIDDHLGSCADCSRQYVALMLGSNSPKTAEAEARQALVPSGAGAGMAPGLSVDSPAAYGIDAPIAARSEYKPARAQANGMPALDVSLPSSIASRAHAPVSSSLVDAITKLRAESDAEQAEKAEKAAVAATIAAAIPVTVASPAPVVVPPSVVVAPIVVSAPLPAAEPVAFIQPSVIMPTPADQVSILTPAAKPAAAAERPAFMARPRSESPVATSPPAEELVVTFSSTPPRSPSYRSPSAVSVITPPSQMEYVSQAVSNLTSVPLTQFDISTDTAASTRNPKTVKLAMMAGAGVLALAMVIGGYRYFHSSVREAAAAAAIAAAQEMTAKAAAQPVAAPVAAASAPVSPRIVYVDRPARRTTSETRVSADTPSTPTPSLPVSVNIPDVNISTNVPDGALLANTSRGATTELTRSAKATASRTSAPRPY